MKKSATYIMVTAVGLLIPTLLAIGSFLGFPNDPQLGGCFWLLIVIKYLVDIFFEDRVPGEKKDESILDNKPAYMLFFDSAEEVDNFTDYCMDKFDGFGKLLLSDIHEYFGLTVYSEDKEIGWIYDQKPHIITRPSKTNDGSKYLFTVEFPKWRVFTGNDTK